MTLQTRRFASSAALAMSLSMPLAALAQDAVKEPPTGGAAGAGQASGGQEGIVVTGTRIAREELESAMPISVTNMENAARLGFTNAYDAIRFDPALGLGQSLSSAGSSGAAGGVPTYDAGISAVNLRNLGVNRSLSLIDGRRQVSSSGRSSQVDIGMIPVGMIDRVEIVTGGAAAVYGADAVTGAVNVVTKRTVEGLQVTATTGISQRGDARERMVSAATGGQFAGGRGSFAIGGTWNDTTPLYYPDRYADEDYIQFITNAANTGPGDGIPDRVVGHYRSLDVYYVPSFSLTGDRSGDRFIYEDGVVKPEAANTITGAATGKVPGRAINFRGALNSLSVLGLVDFAVTDSITYQARFSYARQKYTGELDELYDDLRPQWHNGAGGPKARLDNPFLPGPIREFMIANALTELPIDRAYGNFPKITEHHDRRTWTINQDLGGKLTDRLNWNLFWQYGRATNNVLTTGFVYAKNWVSAYDVIADPATGQPVCRDASARANGCVPLDIFSLEGPSRRLLDYATIDRPEKRVNQQQIFGAALDGALFALPYGDVSIAIGAERRWEKLVTSDPIGKDINVVDGWSLAVGHPDINASMKVSEIYGEVVVPLLRDLPFAHRLELEGAYRYSHYSSFGGTSTWKGAATWAPFDWITLRGVRSRSVRAPNFAELYEPQQRAQVGGGDSWDPCQAPNYNLTPTRAANCRALGVTTPIGYLNEGPFHTSGGNPDLKPEVADTLTLGVVFRPRLLRGFDLTVDYWDIDIKDAVTTLGWSTVVTRCVDLPTIDNAFCPLAKRNAQGALTDVAAATFNAARLSARGLDIGANWRLPLGPGQLMLAFKGSLLFSNVTDTAPGLAAGRTINDGVYTNPKFRGTLLTSYDVGDFSIALNTRLWGKAKYDVNNTISNPEYLSVNRVPARIYNDVSVRYEVNDSYNITLGARNAFDVKPPYFPGAYTNSSVYDQVGRYLYVTVGLNM